MDVKAIDKQLEAKAERAATLHRQVCELMVELAGVEAEMAALSRMKPRTADAERDRATAAGKPSLSQQIEDCVCGSLVPVRTPEVEDHLRSVDTPFAKNSVSTILNRLAEPGGPLRKVGRGLFAARE